MKNSLKGDIMDTKANVDKFLDKYRACKTEPKYCFLKKNTGTTICLNLLKSSIWMICLKIQDGTYTDIISFL